MLMHPIGVGQVEHTWFPRRSKAVCFTCCGVTTVEIVRRSLVLICETGADAARGDKTHPQIPTDSENTTAAAWAVWAWSGSDVQNITIFVEHPASATLRRHAVQLPNRGEHSNEGAQQELPKNFFYVCITLQLESRLQLQLTPFRKLVPLPTLGRSIDPPTAFLQLLLRPELSIHPHDLKFHDSCLVEELQTVLSHLSADSFFLSFFLPSSNTTSTTNNIMFKSITPIVRVARAVRPRAAFRPVQPALSASSRRTFTTTPSRLDRNSDESVDKASTSGEPGESGEHEGQYARTNQDIVVEYPEEKDLPPSQPVVGRGGVHSLRTLAAFSMEGRVAVVTGGARGLGLVMAQALVTSGADVAIVDMNREEGQRSAQGLIDIFKKENPDSDK
jgi:hypothetical protein